MTRVGPQPPSIHKPGHGIMRKVGSAFLFLIRIPFKISLRLLLFVVLLVAFVYVVRTGFWEIPVASALLYREPAPRHEVSQELFSEQLLALKAQEALLQSEYGTASIELSEGELTSLLHRFTNSQEPVLANTAVSVTKEYIEVYGRIVDRPRVVIRLAVIPVVEQGGGISLRPVRAWVGQSPVPVRMISSTVLTWLSPPLFDSLLSMASIGSIELKEHALDMTLHSPSAP